MRNILATLILALTFYGCLPQPPTPEPTDVYVDPTTEVLGNQYTHLDVNGNVTTDENPACFYDEENMKVWLNINNITVRQYEGGTVPHKAYESYKMPLKYDSNGDVIGQKFNVHCLDNSPFSFWDVEGDYVCTNYAITIALLHNNYCGHTNWKMPTKAQIDTYDVTSLNLNGYPVWLRYEGSDEWAYISQPDGSVEWYTHYNLYHLGVLEKVSSYDILTAYFIPVVDLDPNQPPVIFSDTAP